MTYTNHGHHIQGTIQTLPKPDQVARCGGAGICTPCTKDALHAFQDLAAPSGLVLLNKEDIFSQDPESAFMIRAKKLVRDYVQPRLEKSDPDVDFTVYIVWFSKTLQHWKALLSTSLPDGRYYEVTHNGEKNETYIDCYAKIDNACIPDGG